MTVWHSPFNTCLFWRYLTRWLIWHLSLSSIRSSQYFSLIVKSSSIRSWNQPVLSNECKVSCYRKQREPLSGYIVAGILYICNERFVYVVMFCLYFQAVIQAGSQLTMGLIVLVLIIVVVTLSVTKKKFTQIRMCKNKTILLVFITLILLYFMCYTSIWMQAMEFKGSIEKRKSSNVQT